jgi:hypothetical protein
MAMDFAAYDAVLKDYYSKDKIAEMSFADQPWFGMVPKQMAGGRRWIQPVEFNNPGGASAVFATAMTNETSSSFEDFQMSQRQQYQRVLVAHDVLIASRNKDEAFQPAFTEFNRGFKSLGEKVGKRLYRRNTGVIGQLNGSSVSSPTLNLADKADVFNFQIGMRLKASATDGGATYAGVATVTGVDDEAGTVTISVNIDAAFTAPATTAFLYQEGDEANGGTGVCYSGLEDWLPVTDRATRLAAAFNGVTRSNSATKLGGVYLNATAMALDEMLIKLVSKVNKHGGKTDTILMNPEVLGDLQLLENSKRFLFRDINVAVKGESGSTLIGFAGFMANVQGRAVKIVPDRNCPSNRTYALQLDTWKLWHLGDMPGFYGELLGLPMLKPAESSPNVESRLYAYGDLGCNAPGWNGVAEHTAST